MKRQRAGAVLEINQDHGAETAARIQLGDEVVAGVVVRRTEGEQVAGGWLAVLHFRATNDGKNLADRRAELALEALGAGGLRECELRGRVHCAEVIVQRRGERQFQQMSRTGRRSDDAEMAIQREVGGFHDASFRQTENETQWRSNKEGSDASKVRRTHMNIHKYLLPASLAATVHVALLWLVPTEDYVRVVAVALTPPDKPDRPEKEPPVAPEEDPEPETVPVKPLLGSPAPVALEEPPLRPIETEFPMEVATVRPDVRVDTPNLPDVIGDPDGVPDGEFRPTLTIFDVTKLDRAPRATAQVSPIYPYAMSQTGTSGSVWVEFDVDTSGRVVRTVAVRYTEREFAEPALQAVRKWRFEPGRRGGKVVPFRMTVPIEFGIEAGR